MLARYMLSSRVRLSARLSVTSQYYIKRLDESSWVFWHGGFLPPIPHRVTRKYDYLQKLGYFPLGLCSKLRNEKISPGHVNRAVNNTRRLRRRSSLLTTPIRQSTSRGCLLHVDQLVAGTSSWLIYLWMFGR